MKNTVSLHKIWIARTAGLFVLTALAVAYFAFPALTMAKVVQEPKLLTSVKADFMGLVSAPLPNLVDANGKLIPIPANAALDLTRAPKVPLANLNKGAWIAVNLTDTTHQAYGFTATINSIDKTTGKIELLIGTPSSTAMTSQAVIQKYEGNFVLLNVVKDAQGNVIVPPGLATSGWGATAIVPSAPAPKPVVGAPSTVKVK
ncbi:MAG TPA: hypothetical protein VGL94_12785 [Ktedonobacteraceae bacterium]|jgi:hypothetical protein